MLHRHVLYYYQYYKAPIKLEISLSCLWRNSGGAPVQSPPIYHYLLFLVFPVNCCELSLSHSCPETIVSILAFTSSISHEQEEGMAFTGI